MNKEVSFGSENRAKLLEGVQKITRAVACTMGAAGKTVMIGDAVYGNNGMVRTPIHVTKDGYKVSRSFQLPDPFEQSGVMLIQEAAFQTVQEAGDATTATCVIAEALITGGMKLIDEGANSQQLKKGMDAALEYVVAELKKISIPVKGDVNRIRQVATVSANNDAYIGGLIAGAYEKIGDEGTIDIEESTGISTEVKITEGYKFDNGWISPLFVNNGAKELCMFENPLILLYQKRILHHTQIKQAIEISLQIGKPLLIVCEDADEEGLAFLAMNNHAQKIRVCVVKSPSIGTERLNAMEDMALLTGATYVSDQRGIDITKVNKTHFGNAKKIIVTKNETIIIEGEGGRDIIDAHIEDLRGKLAEAKSEDEKYPVEKRIAKIKGTVAVIQVGAATTTELQEKIDRVDDAVRATKAAIAEGFVAGGGSAFLNISYCLIDYLRTIKGSIETEQDERFLSAQLVIEALKMPLRQILDNAGLSDSDIFSQLNSGISTSDGIQKLHSLGIKNLNNVGYNVLTEKIEDMVEAGIIDSTKALRCALVNAVSVAGMVLTSECSIVSTF